MGSALRVAAHMRRCSGRSMLTRQEHSMISTSQQTAAQRLGARLRASQQTSPSTPGDDLQPTVRCGIAGVYHTPALANFGFNQRCKCTVPGAGLAKSIELELVDAVGDAHLRRHGEAGRIGLGDSIELQWHSAPAFAQSGLPRITIKFPSLHLYIGPTCEPVSAIRSKVANVAMAPPRLWPFMYTSLPGYLSKAAFSLARNASCIVT